MRRLFILILILTRNVAWRFHFPVKAYPRRYRQRGLPIILQATPSSAMTVVQLRDELRSRGLKVSGRKAELIERLREVGDAQGSPSVVTTDVEAALEVILEQWKADNAVAQTAEAKQTKTKRAEREAAAQAAKEKQVEREAKAKAKRAEREAAAKAAQEKAAAEREKAAAEKEEAAAKAKQAEREAAAKVAECVEAVLSAGASESERILDAAKAEVQSLRQAADSERLSLMSDAKAEAKFLRDAAELLVSECDSQLSAAQSDLQSLEFKLSNLVGEEQTTKAELDRTFFLNFKKKGELEDTIFVLRKEQKTLSKRINNGGKVVERAQQALDQQKEAAKEQQEAADKLVADGTQKGDEVVADAEKRSAKILENADIKSSGVLKSAEREAQSLSQRSRVSS